MDMPTSDQTPSTPGAEVATQTLEHPRPAKPRQPWLWNVVLLDSDLHTYEYVVKMMRTLFAHPGEKALQIAKRVDGDGRAVCLTTHKEHAELKRDQILAFGRDPLMSDCRGSMHAVIEPAWGEGDAPDQGRNGGASGSGEHKAR
jgi:ATP-dependent Clp protease adaptor protein ClpS